MFLNEGNVSNYLLQPLVFYVPLSFLLGSLTSAVLDALLETQNKGGKLHHGAHRFKPVSLVWSSLVLIFGCISAWCSIHLRVSAVFTLVQTHRPQAQRGLPRSRQRQGKHEGGYTDDAGGLLFSLLISSNLLIPILKPCHVVLLPPFMCRPKRDKTRLYFTAFQPPAVHWSSISFAFTLSVHGQKKLSLLQHHGHMLLHAHANSHGPAIEAFLVIVGSCWRMYQLRFKTFLTMAEDSEWRLTLVHSALLIKLPLL